MQYFNKIIYAFLILTLFTFAPVYSVDNVPNEQGRPDLKSFSAEVLNEYEDLVKHAYGYFKNQVSSGWVRGVLEAKSDLVKQIELDDQAANKFGMAHFYKKFLTENQEKFSSDLMIIAAAQAMLGDPAISSRLGSIDTYGGAVIVLKQYTPTYINEHTQDLKPQDVTIYHFFLEALKSIHTLTFSSEDAEIVQENLHVFMESLKEYKKLMKG